MNIEFYLLIDGEQVYPSKELNDTVQSIINSYIRQTIGGVKEKKVKHPRPNAKGGPRASWSEEQTQMMFSKIEEFQKAGLKPSEVWKKTGEVIGKSAGSVYQYYKTQLKKREKQQTFNFNS